MSTCEFEQCNVSKLVGERFCTDHLTCSSFLETSAAAGGTKSAAGAKRKEPSETLQLGTLNRSIVAFLRSSPRTIYSPSQIAENLGSPKGSITKAITRLKTKKDSKGDPYIVPVGHGMWRSHIGLEELVDIEQPLVCVHAIQMSAPVPLRGGLPPTAAGGEWKYEPRNGQHTLQHWWGSHRVTVALSQTGMCQVSVAASDQALTGEGFDLLAEWLAGFMPSIGLPWSNDVAKIDNLELNRDGRRLVIADCRRFKVQEWRNAWGQTYQKTRDRLRAEVRLSPTKDASLRLSEVHSITERLARSPESIGWSDAVYEPAKPQPWEVV